MIYCVLLCWLHKSHTVCANWLLCQSVLWRKWIILSTTYYHFFIFSKIRKKVPDLLQVWCYFTSTLHLFYGADMSNWESEMRGQGLISSGPLSKEVKLVRSMTCRDVSLVRNWHAHRQVNKPVIKQITKFKFYQ